MPLRSLSLARLEMLYAEFESRHSGVLPCIHVVAFHMGISLMFQLTVKLPTPDDVLSTHKELLWRDSGDIDSSRVYRITYDTLLEDVVQQSSGSQFTDVFSLFRNEKYMIFLGDGLLQVLLHEDATDSDTLHSMLYVCWPSLQSHAFLQTLILRGLHIY